MKTKTSIYVFVGLTIFSIIIALYWYPIIELFNTHNTIAFSQTGKGILFSLNSLLILIFMILHFQGRISWIIKVLFCMLAIAWIIFMLRHASAPGLIG